MALSEPRVEALAQIKTYRVVRRKFFLLAKA